MIAELIMPKISNPLEFWFIAMVGVYVPSVLIIRPDGEPVEWTVRSKTVQPPGLTQFDHDAKMIKEGKKKKKTV